MVTKKRTPVVSVLGLVVLVVIVGVAGSVYLKNGYDRYDKKDFIDKDAYQAIFLMNNEIYFGHLRNISSDYLILDDVYYARVSDEGGGQLIKLGTIEPHSPVDKMIINQDQVLFWENMRPDSQVVETIQSMRQKR